MKALLVITIASLVSSQLTCTQLTCSSIKGPNCYTYNPSSNSATVSPCSSGKACNYNPDSPSESTCEIISTPYTQTIQSLPGSKCSSNKCIDSEGVTCQEGICQGISEGLSCNSTNQCNPGLYCRYEDQVSTCQPLIKAGEACRPTDYCSYGYGCNFGYCVNLFSIQSGMEVDRYACYQGVSTMCQTQNCFENEDRYVYCINPYVNTDIHNKPCSKCTGVSNNGNVSFNKTLDCKCGLSGKSYCPGFTGDKYARKLNSLYQEFALAGYASKCNIESYLDCVLSYGGEKLFWEIVYYENMVKYEGLVYGAKECVAETLLPELYMAEHKSEIDDDVNEFGYFSAIALALYTLFRAIFG